MWQIFFSRAILLFGIVLIGVGCLEPVSRHAAQTSSPKRCTYISSISFERDTSLQDCMTLANLGDAEAAFTLGDFYSRSSSGGKSEAIYWYGKAADSGNVKAMRKVFDAYYFGFDAPKNSAKADEYLSKAADNGAEWAQLILARRIEKTEPRNAMELYLKAARNDNCHAQARMAQAYYQGDITERNPTQAYFWFLLAKVGGSPFRHSDYHPLARATNEAISYGNDTLCLLPIRLDHRIESTLPKEFARIAQDAATKWRKGLQENILPPPPGTGIAEPSIKPNRQDEPLESFSKPKESPRIFAPPKTPEPTPATQVASLPKWAPIRFSEQPSMRNNPKGRTELFKLVSQSVWVVVAARTTGDLRQGADLAQGSAVAVTKNQLLTNCHVIDGRPLVFIKQGDKLTRANVIAGDAPTDRCILSVEHESLHAVQGIRKYENLSVGEEVYTIGSPSGLESTLGQGIISGLRQLDKQRLIQTTAPISPGSSGGGLFDHSGNLVGITTFMVREGQSLNFAIAIEDYFR
jgi:serine protease Do